MKDYSFRNGEKNPNYKHGERIGKYSSMYSSWRAMRVRCNSKTSRNYHRYGGRGISICKEWDNFVSFKNWALNNGWKEGLTIDRIDNDGNYCPENCRWITRSENSKKTSIVKISDEEAYKIRERIKESWYKIAKEYNVSYKLIWQIMKNITHIKRVNNVKECS